MINTIKSENLKYKRTFNRRLILFAPLFFTVIAILLQKLSIFNYHTNHWQILICQTYNWWTVVFIPLAIALLSSLVSLQEKKAGNYCNLRIHNISPSFMWISKIVLMAYHTMLATLVLIVVLIMSGFITAGREIPWVRIFAGGFLMWLTSLAVIPLQLWAAIWKGTFFSMAVGFAGLFAGVVAAPEWYWIYVPWSWPTRVMCPIIGVHPNGLLLEASDPLMNPSVIVTGIVLSLIALIIFTVITSAWFNRMEA